MTAAGSRHQATVSAKVCSSGVGVSAKVAVAALLSRTYGRVNW